MSSQWSELFLPQKLLLLDYIFIPDILLIGFEPY